MQLLKFDNNEAYVRAQVRADRNKSDRASVHEDEVVRISNWLRLRYYAGWCPKFGICHGARTGVEVDWFQRQFPECQIIGTDLLSREHPKVVQYDFRKANEKWLRKADFIYSNSLDHTDTPYKTARVWTNQLRKGGYMFIQWHPWHRKVKGGDCFGADFHEYLTLLEKRGEVVGLLYHGSLLTTIIVGRKK